MKGGKVVTKEINEAKSNFMITKLKKLTNKENCFDIFQQTRVNNIKIYPEKPTFSLIRFKMRKQEKEAVYLRLRLMKGVAGFSGLTFIEITLA